MFRILNRDPHHEPLTDLEREVFYKVLLEHVEVEFEVKAKTSIMGGVSE